MYMLSIWLSFSSYFSEVISKSCGIDNSSVSPVYEGIARIETYPWLGVLYYPHGKKRFTTAVVLVTRQIVLAAANEIDKLPKYDFRSRARVVIGRNCNGPYIGVRDYTYHPDYSRDTYSTLAMIQLETDHVKIELRPICPPPSHFGDENFYAMVLSNNCKRLKLRIHKMKYVAPGKCKAYYRRSGLNVGTLWPSHTACAKSVTGGRCVWRSGAILVVKLGIRWRLLGFGVYGPGCQAPARFLDYGMYHEWVQRSVARIGRPAITNLADNHVVLRRKLSNVQRFGPCDHEETKRELYSDSMTMLPVNGFIRYNVTITSDVEYSCVVFKAESGDVSESLPKIRLRRWCAGATTICYGFGFLQIHFYVEIKFLIKLHFYVRAYGRGVSFRLDPIKASAYIKSQSQNFPKIESYNVTRSNYTSLMENKTYYAFGDADASSDSTSNDITTTTTTETSK